MIKHISRQSRVKLYNLYKRQQLLSRDRIVYTDDHIERYLEQIGKPLDKRYYGIPHSLAKLFHEYQAIIGYTLVFKYFDEYTEMNYLYIKSDLLKNPNLNFY